ncbi:YhdP family protein [Gallaecimonas kandeliae]|uniref:YhdP family protein n=1 Tax=Gallaecimonas kandeliae TaxID=3029055 RepID=UPI00264929F6|nr:YhdP family protein [Gallaecimonas kandeliae]WKE66033.1 YhdP family protein [Gallaecimonas kandeliae]
MDRLLAALGWLARKIWLLLAVALLLAALLVSAGRLLIHRLDDVRPWLVQQANKQLGLNLSIGQAQGDWRGLGPSFSFKDIHLSDPAQQLDLHLDSLSVGLRFWGSLYDMEPRLAYLSGDGLKLKLAAWPKPGQGSKDSIDWRQLEKLFLKQLGKAGITNAELVLPSRYGPRTVEVSKVSWLGGDYRHQAVGQGSIREYGQQQARFILDLYGLSDRLSELDARLFVDAKDLHLDPWVNTFLGDSLTVDKGLVNTKVWMDFEQGRLTGGQLHLTDSSLAFDHHDIKVDDWVATFASTKDGWQLDSRKAKISTDGKPWHLGPMQFRQQGGDQLLFAKQIKLAPLSPLLNIWRELPPPLKHWLAVARPNGTISDLYLAQSAGQKLAGDAKLELGWTARDQLPGLKGLKLDLSWAGDKGIARLAGGDLRIDPGPHFKAPFQLSTLKGDLWLLDLGDHWQLRTGQLALATTDLALDLRGKLDLGDKAAMSLKAEIQHLDAGKVGAYLPLTAMPAPVAQYLTAALKGGSGQGLVLWQGAFADYPYSDNSGSFLAQADLKDLDFQFDPAWPALTQAQLSARFEDAAMVVAGDSAQLAGLPVHDLSAVIPNLGDGATLGIHADTQAPGPDIAALMQASPLAGSVGKALDELKIQGDVAGHLDLSIPLAGGEPRVQGLVKLAGNSVRVLDAFDLTQVSGELGFDNDKLSAKALRARLYDQPLTLTLASSQGEQGYQVGLDMSGRFDAAKVQAPWWQVQGASPWNGHLDLLLKEGDFDLSLKAQSALKGLAASFPFPGRKDAAEAWPLKVSAKGNGQGVAIDLDLGKRARGQALFQGGKVQSWSLGIGDAKPLAQQQGQGKLAAELSAVDLEAWIRALAGKLGGEGGLLPPLGEARLQAGKLLAFGQSLDDVKMVAHPGSDSWQVDASSPALDGQIWLPLDWGREPLLVSLKRLELPKWETPEQGGQGEALAPADIPPFKFFCASCKVLGINLGQLTLEGRPQGEDLLLPIIRQQGKDGGIQGSGTWLAKGDYTDLDLAADVQNIGNWLDDLGLATSLRDAPMKGELKLTWPGGPQEFKLANVDGKVQVKLGQGYVADLSDKGARLLTVFSFDSLRRKLALDFRDLFDKGLFFDKIDAGGELKKGVLTSNQIALDGVVGDMKASGWTDLVHRQLAYDISFKPNVTGNLPVLAAFAVTPITGVAVYALTKIFGPVIDVVTEIRFNLTGAIDNPVLTEVSRSKGSVALPKPPPDQEPDQPQQQQDPQQKPPQGQATQGQGQAQPQGQAPQPGPAVTAKPATVEKKVAVSPTKEPH